jgi:antitoxin (DNA-binding transcriptional repressor) of toxin-antitoxin stability system
MKTISVRELQKCIKECVDHSQKACVVVTRHGRPSAMIIGVEGKDWEHLVTHTAPELAKHIAAKPRRARPKQAVPMQEKPDQERPGQVKVEQDQPAQQSEFLQTVRRFIPGL